MRDLEKVTGLKGHLEFNDEAEYILKRQIGDILVEEANLTNILKRSLMDNIHIIIENISQNTIWGQKGILTLENDLGGKVYRFWIKQENGLRYCLDEVLFDIYDDSRNEIKINIEVVK